MRTRIFTPKERQTLKDHLNGKHTNPNLYRVTTHRIKQHHLNILEDISLMLQTLNNQTGGETTK